jgi:hypothetical protein
MLIPKKGNFDMHTKLKPDAHEAVLVVKTVHETKSLIAVIVAALAGIVGTVVVIWQWLGNKPPDLGLRHSHPIVLVLCVLVLTILAGWLNLKAAREWRRARSDQLSGASTVATNGLKSVHGLAVGSKVRVKAHLSQQEKEAGPGWSPQMDISLGRESVVKSINEHGMVILVDFPKCRFLKEWLDTLE